MSGNVLPKFGDPVIISPEDAERIMQQQPQDDGERSALLVFMGLHFHLVPDQHMLRKSGLPCVVRGPATADSRIEVIGIDDTRHVYICQSR